MKTREFLLAIVFGFYVALTWVKWEEIVAAAVSYCSFVLLTVAELSPATYWRNELAEWWIAVLTWGIGGGYLLTSIVRSLQRRLSQPWSAGARFLSVLTFVALSAPIIATIDPNIQGQHSTTKLLAPLSRGTVVPGPALENPENGGIPGWFSRANGKLLQREMKVAGIPPDQASPSDNITFLFGTDDVGRDVFSRVVFGTRVSLLIGLTGMLGAVAIGLSVGFAAGYSNRFVDSLLMRLTDLVLSIPSLVLVISIVAFLGKSIPTLIILLSLTGWMGIARMVRGEVVRLRQQEFVLAATLLNRPPLAILRDHILTNIRPLLVVAATLQFGNVVLAEASLSFLGLGIQPPTASWGNMLWQSLGSLHAGWWVGVFPGGLLAIVLVASHYVADRGSLVAR